MIKYIKKVNLFVTFLMITGLAIAYNTTKNSYKCMIQLTNYTGEGAYIVISLMNPEGEYEETLYVHGDDDEWYHDISEWWSFYGKKRPNIDAITGETIGGGERAVSIMEIDPSKINAGYKLRFETAVEDKEYYEKDVEFDLTSENVSGKHEGTGFVRYIRLIPNE